MFTIEGLSTVKRRLMTLIILVTLAALLQAVTAGAQVLPPGIYHHLMDGGTGDGSGNPYAYPAISNCIPSPDPYHPGTFLNTCELESIGESLTLDFGEGTLGNGSEGNDWLAWIPMTNKLSQNQDVFVTFYIGGEAAPRFFRVTLRPGQYWAFDLRDPLYNLPRPCSFALSVTFTQGKGIAQLSMRRASEGLSTAPVLPPAVAERHSAGLM